MNRTWFVPLAVFFAIFFIVMHNKSYAADQYRYVGTPVFYSKYVPKSVDCLYEVNSKQGSCFIKNYPENGVVGIASTDPIPKTEAVQVRLYMEVVCNKGICTSPYGEKAGTIKAQETSYWTVPTGFYLYSTDDKVKAYKAGNGPLKKEYPIRDVKLLPDMYDDTPDGYYIPEADTRLNFNVYCNAGNDCTYMGKEITYSELQNYVPKRLSHQCDIHFCYDDKQLIVGLNPKYK